MKQIKLFIGLSFSLLTSIHAFAAEESLVEMKCHVQLLGGVDHLYFAKLKRSHANKLSTELIGRTLRLASGYDDKVYKVVECVNLNSPFKNFASQQLDSQTVR